MPAAGRAIVSAQAREATLDLHFVETILRPAARDELPRPEAGDAFVAGGTWLFSEPQPALRRLVDLHALAWPALVAPPGGGLEIAATCRLAELERFAAPSDWRAAALFGPCVNALWGSFKIRNMATVGGNLCLALPAGPMAALATALDGECLVWTPDGGERRIAAADFVLGAGRNALRAGEVLRALHLPEAALRRRCAFRQASLTRFGRSAALVIGTLDAGGDAEDGGAEGGGAEGGRLRLTVTAATRAPIRIDFPAVPTVAGLAARLAQALPDTVLHDDVHGAPDWKRHMAGLLCEEIRQELDI